MYLVRYNKMELSLGGGGEKDRNRQRKLARGSERGDVAAVGRRVRYISLMR